jgi:ABC-2 type transport system ATP-binding protein
MGIAEIREIIKRIAADGKTIILASHLLDEVQKVCTHFAVLKRGKLMHVGPVDEVGKGEEIVEVQAFHDDLNVLLQEFIGSGVIKKENGIFQVMMKEGFHSSDLNKFLFEKGIVASHLATRKKSLEKQFLEILADSHL